MNFIFGVVGVGGGLGAGPVDGDAIALAQVGRGANPHDACPEYVFEGGAVGGGKGRGDEGGWEGAVFEGVGEGVAEEGGVVDSFEGG